MRYLALDLGERRIGLAVGDDEARMARAVPALRRRSHRADVEALRAVVRDEGVGALLVGLPLTLRGEEGRQAMWTRAQAEALASDLGLPLEYRDEQGDDEDDDPDDEDERPGGAGATRAPAFRPRRDQRRASSSRSWSTMAAAAESTS